MKINKKAIVAGSIGLDIIPIFPEFPAYNSSNFLAQGKFNDMCGTRLYLGGCVGNTGIAMHKLGVPVTLVSKAGQDFIGSVIRKILDEQQVPIHLDSVTDCSSTSTVVIAPYGGDRVLLHSRGASQTFVAEDLDERLLQSADLLHFGYPTAMKYLYRNDGEEFIKLVQKCKAAGLTVSVDMSQPDPNSEAGAVDWKKVLMEALPSIDIFMPSFEEILYMLHRTEFDELDARRGDRNLLEYIDFSMVPRIASELAAMGSKIVLLKVGKKGLYLRSSGKPTLASMGRAVPADVEKWANRRILCPPYYTNSIRSTTGAGDNAIAGFLASFLRGDDPEKALLLASANALRCIESYETTDAVIPLEELDKYVESYPPQEQIPEIKDPKWRYLESSGVCYAEDDQI
ncbi:carbohydrate kinase family protein [Anaerotruncus rubiinfantis]|uniref:carbohydrate kinase family protein n=1 Tax=Anaerotruncus rubiinfantis TaxID=1720200 RepID=UPI0034A3DF6D